MNQQKKNRIHTYTFYILTPMPKHKIEYMQHLQ